MVNFKCGLYENAGKTFLQTRGISTPKLFSQLNATSRRSDVINKSALRDNWQKYQECETALWKIHGSRLVTHIIAKNRHYEFVKPDENFGETLGF